MTVHLVCGPTGAGKSTFARKLAGECGAVRFGIDDWLRTLFHPDLPPQHDISWILERIDRCEVEIWPLVRQLADRNVDAILDHGFSTREHRQKFQALALEADMPLRLHFVTAPVAVRRARVRDRNESRGQTYSFQVPDAMFDFMESRFEPPVGEELSSAHVVLSG